MDIDVDQFFLLANSQDFVAEALVKRGRISTFKRAPEMPRMMLKNMTDIHTFKYDKDEEYLDIGKLMYNRLVPLRLIDAM